MNTKHKLYYVASDVNLTSTLMPALYFLQWRTEHCLDLSVSPAEVPPCLEPRAHHQYQEHPPLHQSSAAGEQRRVPRVGLPYSANQDLREVHPVFSGNQEQL